LIWHPNEQNYLSIPFIRESNVPRGCGKILEIPDEREVRFLEADFKNLDRGSIIRQITSVGWYGYLLEPNNCASNKTKKEKYKENKISMFWMN